MRRSCMPLFAVTTAMFFSLLTNCASLVSLSPWSSKAMKYSGLLHMGISGDTHPAPRRSLLWLCASPSTSSSVVVLSLHPCFSSWRRCESSITTSSLESSSWYTMTFSLWSSWCGAKEDPPPGFAEEPTDGAATPAARSSCSLAKRCRSSSSPLEGSNPRPPCEFSPGTPMNLSSKSALGSFCSTTTGRASSASTSGISSSPVVSATLLSTGMTTSERDSDTVVSSSDKWRGASFASSAGSES
mmetsp:Transcript_11756/g.19121  ORF Transcript_11756/g.19121 Transcript_11756/m.19121 type:complete len:243 (+) Transcript_11756:947-1675(+)